MSDNENHFAECHIYRVGAGAYYWRFAYEKPEMNRGPYPTLATAQEAADIAFRIAVERMLKNETTS